MRGLFAAVIVALAVTVPSSQAQQQRDAIQVDARAEVAAALYAASATQAAAERAADAQLRAQAAEIERLRREGRASRAEIAALEERYVSDLAARDRAYAQEIAVFRDAVEDIASTPEGAAALARFNAGDEVGALAVLDQLVDARDRARRVRADIETAAERRGIAALALETRSRGRLDTSAVIARYEEVIRLDGNEFWDYIELCRLYVDAGRLDDASQSGSRAVILAYDPRSQMVAFIDYADVLSAQGHLDSARALYEAALVRARDLAADQNNWVGAWDLSVALSRLGDAHMARGLFRESLAFYNEALTTDQDWHRQTQYLAAAQNICADLINLTDVIVALGDLAGADQYAGTAVRTCEWVSGQSVSGEDDLRVGYAHWRYANIKAALGDVQLARRTFSALRGLAQEALLADPTNQRIAVEANLIELGFADLELLEGNSSEAQPRIVAAIHSLLALRQEAGLNRLVDTYVWLARVRLAVIPGSSVTWADLRPSLSANSLDVEDLSALDFHFIRLAAQTSPDG